MKFPSHRNMVHFSTSSMGWKYWQNSQFLRIHVTILFSFKLFLNCSLSLNYINSNTGYFKMLIYLTSENLINFFFFSGFTGQYCMIDINECSSEPCKHGSCIDLINGVECNCTGTGKCLLVLMYSHSFVIFILIFIINGSCSLRTEFFLAVLLSWDSFSVASFEFSILIFFSFSYSLNSLKWL